MSDLETQQRGLLNLLKRRGPPPQDPYLKLAAQSRGLAIARRTALFWRTFQLEVQCPQTCRVLKRFGIFDELVENYFDHNATSPFVEELSRDFLRVLRTHRNPLVRAVSQFEFAVLEVKSGSTECFEIDWDRDPAGVFQSLAAQSELPAPEKRCSYRMRIGSELDGLIACAREESAGSTTN